MPRLLMLGTGTFAEPTFNALLRAFPGGIVGCITQPERGTGRSGGSTRQVGRGMAGIAADAGVPVLTPHNINSPEGLAALQAFDADLAVVAAYGQILKPDVISMPKLGMINVHASLLPRHRGAAPVAHAILAGDATTGVTIIRITPGLDAGAMLAKVATDIGPDETAGELEARLAHSGADLAVEVVKKLSLGDLPGEAQDPARVTKAPKLTKEMAVLDWSRGAEYLRRRVYGLQPWPTAYTYYDRPNKPALRLALCAARAEDTAESAPPGTVLPRFRVVCGSGVLRVLAVQPAGKKRMTAEEFLNGYPLIPGTRVGPEPLS
jgi:methionyl-tRNA formyltransferase